MLTKEARDLKAELRAKIREIESPERERVKIARAKARVKREKALTRAPGQRQPRERDPGFLAFLRRLPCIAGQIEGGCEGPMEAAHIRLSSARHGVRNSGMQAKPHDRHATNLCRGHHQYDQHRGSEAAFWSRLGIDPHDYAETLYAAYLAGEDGLAAIRKFIPTRTA